MDSNSETKLRTFLVTEKEYRRFTLWCKRQNKKPTSMIRSLLTYAYVKGMIRDLDLKELKELKEK